MATTTPIIRAINSAKSASGDELFAINAELYVDSRDLAADTAEVFTIPTNANFVIFYPDDPVNTFWYRYDTAAAGPPTWPQSGDVTDGTGWIPNPSQRFLDKGWDSIHVVSAVAMRVTAAFGTIGSS